MENDRKPLLFYSLRKKIAFSCTQNPLSVSYTKLFISNFIDGGKNIPGLRTKVTVAALASIFCSFFFFLSCVWICWYFEVLCWSVGNIRRNRANPVEMSPMHSSSLTPSAPPPASAHDKDLPPSYETLFPDR